MKYTSKETNSLLEKIRDISIYDREIIEVIRYEDYIWWSYPNFKHNLKFESFNNQIELKKKMGYLNA